ncbi:murein L,D-transpeptidase family protein [Actibacterium sp. 188UL27-1]|uniref:L,D-transpeptidase family protein n=1 Tax=Actibacterium sp. 188UL27-1 TaxID=2786961 RepID=UPI001959D75B|nr:L,D-transpeptidase family protein [Actibacterium sp. 188UL27-1]MBM7067301.1 L,D-transpeptidase family protein [Actibacterium sp. 188UL27-1]
MLISKRAMLAGSAAFALSACSSKFKTYDGPQVTRVLVYKGKRSMFLMHDDAVLKGYRFELGFAPQGHKQQEGDGRTPEGNYLINRRNPNSNFHLSLGIDYPNEEDVARALEAGVDPGGDIFIHGQKSRWRKGGDDWTWGCIAVTNKEMEEIYAMVRDGTPIDIMP